MARKIIRGKKNPGPAPERMQRPTREEQAGLFGLGRKQVAYDTPEFLESQRQYEQWAQESQAHKQAQRNNRLVGQRTRLMDSLHIPGVFRNEATRGIADNVVDGTYKAAANRAVNRGKDIAPYALAAGGATAGLMGAAGLAEAYYQQDSEGNSTNPLAILGRGVSNLGVVGSVGTDPLASARLNVQQAQQTLGSDAVLAAVVEDQLAGQAQAEQVFDQQVSALVDARAAELQGTPIQKSDGSVAPMPFDTAIRLAQEEVALQLRAEGIV